MATTSSGASGLILASAIDGMTVASAKVEVPMKCRMRSSPRCRRVVPSGRWPRFCCSRIARQRFVLSLRQCRHSRHCGENNVMTWSPTARSVTPSPSASTTPAPSWPEHRRRVARRVGARGGVHVGVAHATGRQPHEHLPRSGPVEVDLLDDERLPELLQHGGADLHAPDPNRPPAARASRGPGAPRRTSPQAGSAPQPCSAACSWALGNAQAAGVRPCWRKWKRSWRGGRNPSGWSGRKVEQGSSTDRAQSRLQRK